MRRSISDLALALAILVIVALGLEAAYHGYESGIDRVFQGLEPSRSDLEVLLVGNSHLGVLGPHPFGPTSYNLSVGGADLFHMAASLRTVATSTPSLGAVVLGLDYELAGYDLVVANERWKDRQYYPHLGVLYEDSLSNRILARSSFFRANRDLSLLFRERPSSAPPSFRRRGSDGLSTEACAARAREHSEIKYDARLRRANLRLLAEVAEFARGRGIELVCLTPPKSPCYRRHFQPGVASFARRAFAVSCSGPAAVYLDWQAHPDFDSPSLFADADHLATSGATRLAEALAAELPVLPALSRERGPSP